MNARAFQRLSIVLILLTGLIAGIVLVDDFGEGWDEHLDYAYARDALAAYQGERDFLDYFDRMYYGPFHMEISYLGGLAARHIFSEAAEVVGRHFTNYLVFLLGGLGFHYLATRILRFPYSALTTALFMTQPLLFGHGFINKPDRVFLHNNQWNHHFREKSGII